MAAFERGLDVGLERIRVGTRRRPRGEVVQRGVEGDLGIEQLGPAGHESLALGVGSGHGLTQCTQLAANLGRGAARRRHAIAHLTLEAIALGGQLGLGHLQTLGIGHQIFGLFVDLAEIGCDPGGLSLERGDDVEVDGGVAFASEAGSALGQQRGHAAAPVRAATRTA